MELIKINEGKLKIMLTPPDMEKYHLNSGELDCIDGHTREAFKHIFDDAREQVNFDTDGRRLFIQLYTSRTGGCEIFVTTIDTVTAEKDCLLTPSERQLLDRISNDGGKLSRAKKENSSERQGHAMNVSPREKEDRGASADKPRVHPLVFAFDGIPQLICVCRQLSGVGFDGDSRAYIDGDVTYLVLSPKTSAGSYYRTPDKYVFINEFGRRITAQGTRAHLEEHASLLCDTDAVEKLAKC